MASAYVDDDTAKANFRFSDIAEEPQRMLTPIEGYEKVALVSLEQAVEPLIHILPDIRRKVYLAKQHCETPSDNLSSDESASIYLYSMEWEPHEECLCFVLNATLRDPNRQKLKPWFLYLRLFLTGLARLPSIRLTVYRGTKLDLAKDYPTENRFVWWGFSSCTLSIDTLQSDQFLGKTGPRTIFAIECYTAKDIRRHSYSGTKHEVLLLAATQFQVVACLDQGNGLHMIHLKEIDPPFPLIQPVPLLDPSVAITPVDRDQESQITTTTAVRATTPLPNTYHNPKLEELIGTCQPHSLLIFSCQQLTNQDMPIVIKEAIVNKQCTCVWLHINQITSEGVSLLASALHNNTTLTELCLDDNRVSDKGVQFLTQTLVLNNSSLHTLSLANSGITDKGVEYLAEMLKTNITLNGLYLGENEISNAGVKLLANALTHHNTTLKNLSLRENKSINDSSVDSLVEIIQDNRSLKHIWVYRCHLSDNGKSRLRKEAGKTQRLDVYVNDFGS